MSRSSKGARVAGSTTGAKGATQAKGAKRAKKQHPKSRRRKIGALVLVLVVVAILIGLFVALGRSDQAGGDKLASGNDPATGSGGAGGQQAGAASSDASPNDTAANNAAANDAASETNGEPEVRLPPVVSVVHGPDEGQFDGTQFLATFDGEPDAPLPFNPGNWDVTVHSRDPATWDSLAAVDAAHGPNCSPPPDTHQVTAYEDAAFLCKSHLMTSIRGDGYGLIYLTPSHMVDFSQGTAVISLEMSTLRTSNRDWWDIWISPYDDALQLPFDLDDGADLTGPPRDSIRVGLGVDNQMMAEIYDDFENVQFPEWPESFVSGDTWTGYHTFLDPDMKRRDRFEIHISQTHLKVGMPDYDFWWIDTDIPELDWTTGVVQFGHHSYNPTKDCNTANNPVPTVDECLPNTWHWDNLMISPAVPFTIVRAQQRTAFAEAPTLTFAAPAPADAKLRFAGIGLDLMVRFDDGSWQPATVQQTEAETSEEHFASYWMDVPAGTTQVEFQGTAWYGGAWHVRDATFWSLDS